MHKNVFRVFAFYTCFRIPISQIQFRILYVVRFRTFAFSHFAFYTCPGRRGMVDSRGLSLDHSTSPISCTISDILVKVVSS